MLRHLITYIIVLAAGLSARSQAFDVLAGSLSTAGLPAAGATITLRGSLDASDLDYLCSHLKHAETLDLSGVKILPWSGRRLAHGLTSSPGDVLPPYIFAGLKVDRLILPSSLKVVADGALMQADIRTVEIPAGVDSIGMAAFSQCRSLTSVTLPEAVTAVPPRAFDGCVSLASVSLPDGVTAIGARAFYGCEALQQFTFPHSLTQVGSEAFSHTGLKDAGLGTCSALRQVGDYAFASSVDLEGATLPAGVRSLGEGAFWECPRLKAVSLPVDMSSLAPLMFKGDSSLTSLSLPDGLTSMGQLALAGTSVSTIALPSGLVYIDDNAFESMGALKHIDATLLSEVPALGSEVWAAVRQDTVSLHVDDGVADVFRTTPQWQEFRILDRSQSALVPLEADGFYRVSFDGPVLTVECDKPLREVALYNLDGRSLAAVTAPSEAVVRFDTSPWHTSFFILSLVTGDSVRHVLKITR